jgi:hypothetical protein
MWPSSSRKSQSLLRDPIGPGDALAGRHRLWTATAQSRSALDDNSVALVVTSPPFLNIVDYRRDNWLRCWFAGIDSDTLPRCTSSLSVWMSDITLALREIHRVLRPSGHAAVEVGEIHRGQIALGGIPHLLRRSRRPYPLEILIHTHPFTKTSRCWGIANNKDGTNTHRVVVFQKR